MAKTAQKNQNSGSSTPKQPKSGRVFNIVQYERSPIDGSSFNFGEANILSCVAHSSITRYGYIRHDRDHYSEKDILEFAEKYNIQKTLNDVKEPHWHVVLEVPCKLSVAQIAKWLNVPENQVEVPNEKGKTPITVKGCEKVFMQCISYLTHADIRQQTQDKTLYSNSEVKANFDWEPEVEALLNRKNKYGKELTDKEWFRNEVLTNGLRPKDMMHNPLMVTFYTADCDMLDKLRKKYLREYAPMPSTRFNYYIYSDEGRVGKGVLSRAFARSLFPEIDDDDDLFFSVGGEKVSFDSYDGQPVIIWNDIRPYQLLQIFGGRGQLLDTLDSHPVRKDEHVKFGKICLTNVVNIFNSVLPYWQFFDELSGEYKKDGNTITSEVKQKEQVYGRFPMVIPVSADDFGILLNKGFMGEGAFTEYYEHQRVAAHLRRVHETLSAREDLVKKIDADTVAPLIEVHDIVEKHSSKRNDFEHMTDDEVLAYYSDEGHVMTDAERDAHLHKMYDAEYLERRKYIERVSTGTLTWEQFLREKHID